MGWAWLLAPIGLAQPVLLALLVPRRWLRWALLGWLALPIPVWGVVVLQELATRPASPDMGRNLVLGFGIVMSTIGLAWVVGSGLCFAVGLWLRRWLRPGERAPSAPVLPAPAPAEYVPAQDAALEMLDSPDGRLRVTREAVEWANTQWVRSPRVEDRATGQVLFSLLGTNWDAEVHFPEPDRVWLGLRRYRWPGAWTLLIDVAAGTGTIRRADGQGAAPETLPLKALAARLEALSQDAFAAEQPVLAPPPHRFAAWRSALVILICTLAAIAGLTWLTLPKAPQQELQKLPEFPLRR